MTFAVCANVRVYACACACVCASTNSPHTQFPVSKCSVLVCWLGHESLQAECVRLVRQLWSQGVAADLVYGSMELEAVEDIQEFCRGNLIPHVVILSDRTLYYERKQVKVRTLDSGKVSEKVVNISELVEFVQQRGLERSDSSESTPGPVRGEGHQTKAMPPVNVTIVGTGKLPGHVKRRHHDLVGGAIPYKAIAVIFSLTGSDEAPASAAEVLH